ncbi:MAG: hypothetical protein ACOYXY_01035 [Thermodesulfobacteriota bacterium]
MSKKQPDIRDNLHYRRLVKLLKELPPERTKAFEEFLDEEENEDRMKLKDKVEARLMNLERAVQSIQEELQALRAARPTAEWTSELVPLPPREGKKLVGERAQFATIIDKTLLDGLKHEARERGTTFARMIETAIWHFLSRPRLSFEIDEENDQ